MEPRAQTFQGTLGVQGMGRRDDNRFGFVPVGHLLGGIPGLNTPLYGEGRGLPYISSADRHELGVFACCQGPGVELGHLAVAVETEARFFHDDTSLRFQDYLEQALFPGVEPGEPFGSLG